MYLHPNTCPGCNSKPYPRGVACATCGFVGEDWDQFQSLRARFAWVGYVVLVLVLLVPLIFLMALLG